MSASSTSSTFSRLLARSKYATYDPSIAQLYTAPKAHLARGDLGLKRPVYGHPVVRVSSLDTPDRHTAYRPSSADAATVRRLREMQTGFMSHVGDNTQVWTSYGSNDGIVSKPASESQPQQQLAEDDLSKSGVYGKPDLDAMSEREFKRYLEQVRTLRGQFASYLQTQAERQALARHQRAAKAGSAAPPSAPPVDLFQTAQTDASAHHFFLASYHAKELSTPTSRKLVPAPHPTGGLLYASPTEVHARRIAPSIPGRLLPQPSRTGRMPDRQRTPVAIAGLVAQVETRHSGARRPTDFGFVDTPEAPRDLDAGKGQFRPHAPPRIDLFPRVVSNTSKPLDSVRIHMEVRETSFTDEHRANPHALGSPEYVAHTEARRNAEQPFNFVEGFGIGEGQGQGQQAGRGAAGAASRRGRKGLGLGLGARALGAEGGKGDREKEKSHLVSLLGDLLNKQK